MISRFSLLALTASLTLTLDAHGQTDNFALELTDSKPVTCRLTASFHGPANGTAILFAGRTGSAPVQTPWGTLHISNGFMKVRSIQLSPTGTGSTTFRVPDGLTIGLQAALVDAQGNLSALSAYGAITRQRGKSGKILAGAWTTLQSGVTTSQLAIEAGKNQAVDARTRGGASAPPARRYYSVPGWLYWMLLPNRTYAVYVDGIFMGYIRV